MTKRKFNKVETTILLVIGVIAIKCASIGIDAWNNRPVMCVAKNSRFAYAILEPIYKEWTDEYSLSMGTSRINLPQRISALQAIRRKVEQQEWPECAQGASGALISGMNTSIDAIMRFMGNTDVLSENLASMDLEFAEKQFGIYRERVQKLHDPQPPKKKANADNG